MWRNTCDYIIICAVIITVGGLDFKEYSASSSNKYFSYENETH